MYDALVYTAGLPNLEKTICPGYFRNDVHHLLDWIFFMAPLWSRRAFRTRDYCERAYLDIEFVGACP